MTKEKFSQKVKTESTWENTCNTQPNNRTRNIINHGWYTTALRDAANLVVIILNLDEKCCNN